MAGAGWKQWTRERLSQSDLQQYLQDQVVQVYASAAARNTGQPTPSEGMVSYLADVDRIEVYRGPTFGWVASDSGPAIRGQFARTDNSSTLNANAVTDLTAQVAVQSEGGGWGTYNPGVCIGYSNPLPGRYAISAYLGNSFGADGWQELILYSPQFQGPLGGGNQNAGFGGSGGGIVLECPAGLSFGFRFQTSSSAAGSIRGGSHWRCARIGDTLAT